MGNITRDGALKSLWQKETEQYQPKNAWEKESVYDVLIVGAGITGLSTALQLQTKGKKCVIAEAHNIGFGTTGGTTAHLNTILDTSFDVIERDFGAEKAKLVASSTREAIDIVESLVEQYNIDCDFSYEAAYIIAQNEQEKKMLDDMEAASERAGIAIRCVENVPYNMSFVKSCRIDMQAQFHPTKYLLGLADAYEGLGGVLLQNCIVSTTEKEELYTVNTSLGLIKAKQIVYATHIPPGINLLHFRCAPYRSYAAAFTIKGGQYPEGLLYDLKEPYNYFRTHVIDGKKYIVGGGFDHKTGHDDNTEQVLRELEAFLRTNFDVESIDYKWSSQYYVPADGLPYIGKLPGSDDIYTATGFNGNGMVLGTLSGKIIADMILGIENPYTDLYKPSRIKPIAGFINFVKENADVVSKFIGMRFSYEKVSALAELAPGDATLAEWEGKKVALHKDEQGKIHALDPVCPHAKCIVGWNNAEKSWDCPCHGARFAANGALLNGPATKGLTQIKWEDIEGD